MMRILVFGATGPTGRLLLQQGLEQGFVITAFARNPSALELQHRNLHVVQGDVFDASSVEQAMTDQGAVIAVFGTSYSFKEINTYSVGIKNIIAGMQKHGIKRLIVVTSSGANPHYDPREGFLFGRIIKNTVGKTVYSDMRIMEALIQQSNLEWTIVRPSRLINTFEVTDYRTGEGYILHANSVTSRINLAHFLLREAKTPQYLRKGVAVAD